MEEKQENMIMSHIWWLNMFDGLINSTCWTTAQHVEVCLLTAMSRPSDNDSVIQWH